MRKFKNLLIWQESMQIVKDVYKLSKLLPDYEKYGIGSQIQRAAVSIPSNIAERCSRKSSAEFARFLEISLGSAFELETQLIIINELQMITQEVIIDGILTDIEKLQKMINSLKTKTRS